MARKLTALLLVTGMIAVMLAGCGESEQQTETVLQTSTETTSELTSEPESASKDTEEQNSAETESEEQVSDETEENTEAEEETVTEADLNIEGDTVTVEYGEFEKMSLLSQAIHDGEKTDCKVVIDGISKHYGSSYSIMEPNETGNEKIGTKYVVKGWKDDKYPKDGETVHLEGTVVKDSKLSMFYISVQPDDIKVTETEN